MNYRALLLVCFSLALTAAHPQEQWEEPALIGYVTRVASNTDFDVNGYRVLCSPRTMSSVKNPAGKELGNEGCPALAPYVGEPMTINGSLERKKRTVVARRIVGHPAPPSDVSGEAVIDALPPRSEAQAAAAAAAGTLLIRADGYRILLTGATEIAWSGQVQALGDVRPGDWIQYWGRLDNFGLLVATNARIARDSISVREEKLRTKSEYDPAAVPADAKQNETEKLLFGQYNARNFPPYKNPAMQARVDAIGNKLIPAYQRALPDSDPAKIHFRFQLVNAKQLRDAWALPSGIILVPRQVVDRMENDSQLAAVLADSIARTLEKEQYRDQRAERAAKISSFDNLTAFAFVALPPAEAASWIVGRGALKHLAVKELEQSSRESLALLHDAGYDIDQAPVAWWLLLQPKPLVRPSLQAHPAYLYRILGEEWRNPASAHAADAATQADSSH